jgi:hypothetical protein
MPADNTRPAARPARPTPRRQREPDLVDRIFDYLADDPRLSGLPAERLEQLQAAVRAEFAGEECYITSQPATARQELAASVLRLFDGRNATEVARRLQISRATVYRVLKQARRPAQGAAVFRVPEPARLTFPGNETAAPVVSE